MRRNKNSVYTLRDMRLPQTSIELRERRLALAVNGAAALGAFAAAALAWRNGFGWTELWLFLPMYIAGEIGAEVGHHRLFSHQAFKPVPAIKILLAILASMGGKGSVFEFAAVHRRHHHYSDRPGDPHSPHEFGGGLRGFFHGYFGWLVRYPMSPAEHAWVLDLIKDPVLVRWANKYMYYVWLTMGLLMPTLVGFILENSAYGALMGLLWGGAVRIFLQQHSAYAINTVCHLFGSRPFKTKDESRNNTLLALLTLGVGWHNNHHAFPGTAYNQFEWWQLDPCGWFIRGLEKAGLVKEAYFPSPEDRKARANGA